MTESTAGQTNSEQQAADALAQQRIEEAARAAEAAETARQTAEQLRGGGQR